MGRLVWLYLAWLVAIGAMAGSLYFSEVRSFVPCALCWWQRILMYPLVPLLGIATFRQDAQIWRYALPLSTVGLATSTYHYLIQKVPGFAPLAQDAGGVLAGRLLLRGGGLSEKRLNPGGSRRAGVLQRGELLAGLGAEAGALAGPERLDVLGACYQTLDGAKGRLGVGGEGPAVRSLLRGNECGGAVAADQDGRPLVELALNQVAHAGVGVISVL